MLPYSPAHRVSQWDAPIPISSFEEVENRAQSSPFYKPSEKSLNSRLSRSPSLVSPLGTTYTWKTDSPNRHTLHDSPPRSLPRSTTLNSEAAFSDISQLSTPFDTPCLGLQSRPFKERSVSPSSDKEATPPQHSYLSGIQELRRLSVPQPVWSEKQVVPDSYDFLHPAYSGSSTSYTSNLPSSYPSQSPDSPLNDAGFGQPLAYNQSLAYNQALGTTSNDPNMNFFRRNPSKALRVRQPEFQPQVEAPAPAPAFSHVQASVSVDDEKRSLGPQDTGVVHADSEVGFGYGVQDEDKQPLTVHQASITAQIAEARSMRVRAVVDTHIEPLLRREASNGISRLTLVLVPGVDGEAESGLPPTFDAFDADVKKPLSSDDDNACQVLSGDKASHMLVGFPSVNGLHLVRLGPAHSGHTGHSGTARDRLGDQGSRFWEQGAVIAELDRLLRIRLVGMGLDVEDADGVTAAYRRSGWAGRGERVGATLPAAGAAALLRADQKAAAANGGTPWRGAEVQAGPGIWAERGAVKRDVSSWQLQKEETLLPGQASVKVELQKVTFRAESAMGLYSAWDEMAVVVSIAIEVHQSHTYM